MFLHTLSRDLLAFIFTRMDHSELDRLLCTSRGFREIANTDAARRCRLAHSVFENCAKELRKRLGSSRGERSACLRASFEGRYDERPVLSIDIRMHVRLVQDQLHFTVSEERDFEGTIIRVVRNPFRLDSFVVWPAENRIDRNLNGTVEPPIPVPEELVDYLCAQFMCPAQEEIDDDMEVVCVNDRVYGSHPRL